ncbi:MAG: DNA repair protein RecN, partial [Muribaculaceae bacterium]|nr:DNA repair protein RecN [Muribaculaceae bacterium]
STITHLPGVAAGGDVHFNVFKQDDDDSTFTQISQLDDQQRIDEIAAMISGNDADEAARATARRLLQS